MSDIIIPKGITVLIGTIEIPLGDTLHLHGTLEGGMKISEHVKPKFDPMIRVSEKKSLLISLTPDDWYLIEKHLGRHITGIEIRELIMGLFNGTHKIVKR